MKIFIILVLSFTLISGKDLVIAVGENSVLHTISQKVLEIAYAKIGLKPQFVPMQINTAIVKLNAGEVDGDVSRVKPVSDRLPNIIQVPVEINHIEAVAFSKSSTINITNWKDLESYKFTIIKGAKFIDYATKEMNKTIVYDYKEAFENLNNDITEVVVIPKKTGQVMIQELGLTHINIVSPTLEHHALYHVLHKDNSKIAEKLTPVLKEMKKNGQIKRIHDAYHTYK